MQVDQVYNNVPRDGFNLSVIILVSVLVFPMLGWRHFLLEHCNILHFFSSSMHIFKHYYLYALASRGTLPRTFGVNVQV